MKHILFFCIFINSCSTGMFAGKPKEGKRQFSYVDVSGAYVLSREHKLLKTKLISRMQLASSQGSAQKPVEKSIAVSQLGTVQGAKGRSLVVRPFASEFSVWLEGKKYESKMKLDPRTKSMVIDLNSPEEKWKGRQTIPFPKGTVFCFFSQLPECLFHSNLLVRAHERQNESLQFYIVWDSYPYIQEQYNGLGAKLFTPASTKFEGVTDGQNRFVVELEGQSIAYHFSKSFDLVRMFWIAQGISIVPPGEEITDVEE